MTQYLVAIYCPDNYDPSIETQAMSRDIDALNDEMKAAGVRIFVGGLRPATSAMSLRARSPKVRCCKFYLSLLNHWKCGI
jgi:hypothetical protein